MNCNLIEKITDDFAVFRDDLFPFLGGGNKGRKILSIAKEIEEKGYNAIVTTGGIQSNHCRAVAVYAALKNHKCSLILHGDQNRFYGESGNAKIMRSSGAEIVFSENPENISVLMDNAMKKYIDQNLNPYYLWGGGHTMEGGNAYIHAVKELRQYSDKNNWVPDYIFHASGTGSTQAGILAGLDKYEFNETKVIGISVARSRERAQSVISSFYEELCQFYKIKLQHEVTIEDEYLCGGYEKFNEELYDLSINSLKKYGFLLDTTYTGKAFWGMKNYIRKFNLKGNILFWHTGGIFNFFVQ